LGVRGVCVVCVGAVRGERGSPEGQCPRWAVVPTVGTCSGAALGGRRRARGRVGRARGVRFVASGLRRVCVRVCVLPSGLRGARCVAIY
jgi:hypothetical protein